MYLYKLDYKNIVHFSAKLSMIALIFIWIEKFDIRNIVVVFIFRIFQAQQLTIVYNIQCFTWKASVFGIESILSAARYSYSKLWMNEGKGTMENQINHKTKNGNKIIKRFLSDNWILFWVNIVCNWEKLVKIKKRPSN